MAGLRTRSLDFWEKSVKIGRNSVISQSIKMKSVTCMNDYCQSTAEHCTWLRISPKFYCIEYNIFTNVLKCTKNSRRSWKLIAAGILAVKKECCSAMLSFSRLFYSRQAWHLLPHMACARLGQGVHKHRCVKLGSTWIKQTAETFQFIPHQNCGFFTWFPLVLSRSPPWGPHHPPSKRLDKSTQAPCQTPQGVHPPDKWCKN